MSVYNPKGRVTKDYVFFYTGKFSQFYPSTFKGTILDDEKEYTFNCAEQYMMASKAKLFKDEITFEKIMKESEPRKIKSLGRKVKGFNEEKWNEHRLDIVSRGNYFKFSQDEQLKKALLDTGDRELVEASPSDTIWGVGLYENDDKILSPENWRGLNLLGKALVNAREKIKQESQ